MPNIPRPDLTNWPTVPNSSSVQPIRFGKLSAALGPKQINPQVNWQEWKLAPNASGTGYQWVDTLRIRKAIESFGNLNTATGTLPAGTFCAFAHVTRNIWTPIASDAPCATPSSGSVTTQPTTTTSPPVISNTPTTSPTPMTTQSQSPPAMQQPRITALSPTGQPCPACQSGCASCGGH